MPPGLYSVICDRCRGSKCVDGLPCPKCGGFGMVQIVQRRIPLTANQRLAVDMAAILLVVCALTAITVPALHYFKVL